jgi:CheY-like chemotaxis protein
MNSGKTILIVEDHVDSAQSLARCLVKVGHSVQVAGNLAEARALAGAHQFDLALCDLGLPDGDGCDLMRELQSTYGMRGVALTGFGMTEDIERAADAGFAAHLLKPIVLEKLLAVVDKVTSQVLRPIEPPAAGSRHRPSK